MGSILCGGRSIRRYVTGGDRVGDSGIALGPRVLRRAWSHGVLDDPTADRVSLSVSRCFRWSSGTASLKRTPKAKTRHACRAVEGHRCGQNQRARTNARSRAVLIYKQRPASIAAPFGSRAFPSWAVGSRRPLVQAEVSPEAAPPLCRRFCSRRAPPHHLSIHLVSLRLLLALKSLAVAPQSLLVLSHAPAFEPAPLPSSLSALSAYRSESLDPIRSPPSPSSGISVL